MSITDMGRDPANIGTAERIGSAIVGAVLIGRAIVHPSIGRVLLAIGGAALLQHGLSGCRTLGMTGTGDGTDEPDMVEIASDDSFPASDPPSWTPVKGPRASHHH